MRRIPFGGCCPRAPRAATPSPLHQERLKIAPSLKPTLAQDKAS